MLLHRNVAQLIHGHDEYLRGVLERVGEARRVAEVTPPHTYSAVAQRPGLVGIADADPDLVRRHALEELLNDAAAELAGRAGDDVHEISVGRGGVGAALALAIVRLRNPVRRAHPAVPTQRS